MNAKIVLALTVSLATAALPLLAAETQSVTHDGDPGSIAFGSHLAAGSAGSEVRPVSLVVGTVRSPSSGGPASPYAAGGESSLPLAFVCTGLLGLVAHYLRVRRE